MVALVSLSLLWRERARVRVGVVAVPLVTVPLVTIPLVTIPLVTIPLVTIPLVTIPLTPPSPPVGERDAQGRA